MMHFAPEPDDQRLTDVGFWRNIDTDLPPVLTGRGEVSVVAIYRDATLYRIDAMYGEVQVLMYHGPPLHFRYWIWDEASALISCYEGSCGDPEEDTLLDEYPY